MSYHITLASNDSNVSIGLTNPAHSGDNKVITPGQNYQPPRPVEINTAPDGNRNYTYLQALMFANNIVTGKTDYCFWDNGSNEIRGVTQQSPDTNFQLLNSPAGDIQITCLANGELRIVNATTSAAKRAGR